MTGCTTGMRVGRRMLALALAASLCAAVGLMATMPSTASAQPAKYKFTIYADQNISTDPIGDPLGANPRYAYVDEGAGVTFMFMPMDNYAIDTVSVDGVDVTAQLVCGTYTFSNVSEDHVIRASSKLVNQKIEGFPTLIPLVEGDTVSWTPTPAGGTWWISDPSLLSYEETAPGSGTYEFTALKPGGPYAMYAVGDLVRRVSIGISGVPFDAGNLRYEVLSERASGGSGAPGENTVRLLGAAAGQSPSSIVIPARVSGNPKSPGTVYEVVEVKSSAFANSATIESVDFADCVITSNASFLKNDVFRGCTGLKQLIFGQNPAPTITNAFYNAGDNGIVHYPEGATGYQTGMFKSHDGGNQLPNWTFQSYPAPGAPQSLAAAPGDGQVELSWTAPSEGMGIQKYQYSVAAEGGADSWQDVPGSDRSTTSYEVTGLANRTSYTLKVRAVNGAGEGAAATVAATPGTPTAPEDLVAVPGRQQVALSWTAVPDAYNATKYQYSATADGTDSWQDVPGSNGSATSYTVPGLTDGASYTFKVRAVNAVGDGEAAAEVTATPGAPSAPQNLAAVPGDGQVELSWAAVPAAYNATKYQYSASVEGGPDSWQDVPGSDGATTGFTVTGLENGTAYALKVRAVNAVGEGEASSASAALPVKLVSIAAPRAVVGIASGTPLADIPLPSQATLKTEKGDRLVDVAWDRTSAKPAYDPTSPSKQTFVIGGSVVLPADVVNPGGIPLRTSVSVTVDAKAAPMKPQPLEPSRPKPLVPPTGDGALPLIPLGIAVLAGGVALAARKLRLR